MVINVGLGFLGHLKTDLAVVAFQFLANDPLLTAFLRAPIWQWDGLSRPFTVGNLIEFEFYVER